MQSRLRWTTSLALLTLFTACADAQQTTAPDKMPGEQEQATAAIAAPVVIEDQAMNLLQKSQQAMLALSAYSAECRTIVTRDKPAPKYPNGQFELATLTAEKPNKLRYDRWDLAGSPPPTGWTKPTTTTTYTFACDGKVIYKQFGTRYRQEDDVRPVNMRTLLEPWRGFYTLSNSPYGMATDYRKEGTLKEARVAGREAVEGVVCDKVFTHIVSLYNEKKIEYKITWYIGPDGLMRRCVDYVSFDDAPGMTTDATLTNIRVNAPSDAALYAYSPPPGVTKEKDEKSNPLLANGTLAPNFAATDINKQTVQLSDLRGKVVILDFWASWCAPCNQAMPHNQAVMKKLKAEGLPVVMLAVDDSEKREAFEAWVTQKQAALSELRFVYSPQKEDMSGKHYNVTGIPTQYVLDRQGVIRASFVGFDATDALEKAVRAAYSLGDPVKAVTATSKK